MQKIMNVALLIALASASTASAHRSGCHRWHTCPSDTGSYTMGSPAVNVPTTRSSATRSTTTRRTTTTHRSTATTRRTTASGYAGPYTNTNVNLRAGASSASRVLRVIPVGTPVNIYSCGVKWCNVQALGTRGWMVGTAITR